MLNPRTCLIPLQRLHLERVVRIVSDGTDEQPYRRQQKLRRLSANKGKKNGYKSKLICLLANGGKKNGYKSKLMSVGRRRKKNGHKSKLIYLLANGERRKWRRIKTLVSVGQREIEKI